MKKGSYFKKLEQDLIYIFVFSMAIMVDAFIVPNYFQSIIWRIDGILLFLQGIMFMFEVLNRLNNNKNADIQEDIDIMNDLHDSIFENGQGKFMVDVKSVLIKVLTGIIIIRLVLHIFGFQNI